MTTMAGGTLRQAAARDVMQVQVLTVAAEMTVPELAQTLLEGGVRSAPVVDGTGRVLGLASQADVTRVAFAPAAAGAAPLRVRDLVRPDAPTVDPDEPLPGLVRLFLRGGAPQALVVHNGMLLGIVTPMDVLRALDDDD